MRRFFILFLVLVGVALFITQFTVTDPGYIAIAYQDWLIETSVAAAGIASIIGLILILLFAQLIIFLLQMPVFMRHRRFISRAKKSQYQHMQWTENGLIALAKGNWAKAEKYLIDAA
ncbi:MAG: heme biosynthesis HemY N-terminal domain-containing protein, partial [Pseudomonadota bacterium]